MKRIYLSMVLPFLLLSACSNKKESTEPTQEGDKYVDVLPSDGNEGVILHAFDWKFEQIKNNLPAISEAGYKVVQTSPVAQPKSGGANWMMFYQPVSFSIADNSPLGSKQDLQDLCTEADKYGINIICDIVFNHMGTNGQKDSKGLPVVDKEVETYEPYIYQHQDECFRHYTSSEVSGSGLTTMLYDGLPDLNTGNAHVQERALSLLKECIDVGVDGFRFDAAKHIETSKDTQYASNFWENTLGVAKEYYKTKNSGKELIAYGEILNDVDGGRPLTSYTSIMKVTDNSYGNDVYTGITKKDPSKLIKDYSKSTDCSNLITWVESHDTFLHGGGGKKEKSIARMWSILAARKDTMPLFFARPDTSEDNCTVGKVADYNFESEYIAISNRFHNRFVGANEEERVSGDYYVNERYSNSDQGALVFDSKGTEKGKVTFTHLEDGYYFDQMTNKQYHVKGGKTTIEFHEYGYAILTKTNNPLRVTYTVSQRDTKYVNGFKVKLEVQNASSAAYILNDGAEVPFTGSVQVDISGDLAAGQQTKLTLKASNGVYEIKRSWIYEKIELIDGYFNVLNVKPEYLSDYELYIWSWSPGKYSKDKYTYNTEKRTLLIANEVVSGWAGFLLVLFTKNTAPKTSDAWDDSCLKQTGDIDPKAGFFDAQGF